MLLNPDGTAHNPSRTPLNPFTIRNADLAAIVPLEYWQVGADVNPEQTQSRTRLLTVLEQLSEGTYNTYRRDAVHPNYYGRAATFLGNLGSAFPPVFTGLDPAIATPLENSLKRSINQVLVDVIRFGTGLWRLRLSLAGRPVLERVDPKQWYPASTVEKLNDEAPADALVAVRNTDTEKWAQVLELIAGEYQLTTYKFNGTLLGEVEEVEAGPAPSTRMLYPIALPPSEGEWGRSAYIDMWDLAEELARRFSANSQTLDDYARPMLVVKGAAAAHLQHSVSERINLQAKALLLNFDDGRRQPVWGLPPGIDDVKFVEWDAQQQASFAHIDRVEDTLFDMSALPSGLGRMADKLASGASLRRLWAPTYVLLETIRSAVTLNLENAVVAAGELLNIPVDGFTIDWPNPLDQLDEQRIVQGGPDDMNPQDEVEVTQ